MHLGAKPENEQSPDEAPEYERRGEAEAKTDEAESPEENDYHDGQDDVQGDVVIGVMGPEEEAEDQYDDAERTDHVLEDEGGASHKGTSILAAGRKPNHETHKYWIHGYTESSPAPL